MTHHALKSVGAVILIGSLAACSENRPGTRSCESDVDCGGNGYCYNQVCVANCLASDTCADGRVCVTGVCVDSAASCTRDNGGCDINAHCSVTDSDPTCRCRPGFAGDGRSCTQRTPRWSNPLPQGNDLNGIWVWGPDDAFIVGDFGTLMRWRNNALTQVDLGRTDNLRDVFGFSLTDVWIVGEGGLALHSTAEGKWTPVATGTTATLNALWGAAANDIWAVGEGGTILHSDGTSWAPSSSGTDNALLAVTGASTTKVVAVGKAGTLLEWDGNSWATKPSPTTSDITSVACKDDYDSSIAITDDLKAYNQPSGGSFSEITLNPTLTAEGALEALALRDFEGLAGSKARKA